MDYFQNFPTEKVATHFKIFLGVMRNIWYGRNACDKKKIQHLLEAQCVKEQCWTVTPYYEIKYPHWKPAFGPSCTELAYPGCWHFDNGATNWNNDDHIDHY